MKIRDKLIVTIFGLTAAPIICISSLAYLFTKETIHHKITEKQRLVINEVADNIVALNKDAAVKVLLLKDLPSLSEVIRFYPTGSDPLREESLAQWAQRYQAVLISMMGLDERVDQVRFIYEDGQELMRVFRESGSVRIASKDELQDTSQHTYFKEAMALGRGQVYVSEMGLSIEKGVIEQPLKPLVRYATAVFDGEGHKKGIVVVNYRMDNMLYQVFSRIEIGRYVLTDEKGDILFLGDDQGRLVVTLGSGRNYFNEQPELVENTSDRDYKQHYDAQEKEYRIWKKVYYDPNDRSKFWVAFSVIPQKTLFASLHRLRDIFVMINVFVLAIVVPTVFLTARSLSKPIEQLKADVDEYSVGRAQGKFGQGLLKRRDEIGVLARAFDEMVRKLTEARLNLEKRVEERTAQLQQAKRIAEINEKRFEQFFESLPDAIVMVNKEGEIVLVNAMTEKLFGYRRQELVGEKIEVLVPERFMAGHVGHRKEYANRPFPRQMAVNLDIYAKRKDGSEFAAEINLNPMRVGDELLISSAVRDISERKMNEMRLRDLAEELKRSNAELEQFAYVASHDLQEPLRMVASYTQLLARRLEGKLDDKAAEYIRYAVDGASRMQKLINDLLSFSRIGKRGETFKEVDCNFICLQALDNLRVSIQRNKVSVAYDPLPIIFGDATQLLQLFQNLLSNSIKFRSDRDPHIHISAVDRGNVWEFSFKDNGIGIDKKYAERVFIIFERLHSHEMYEGTGIGLAVCKKIVERHGGRIWIESQEGQGTTFYFTIAKKGGLAHEG